MLAANVLQVLEAVTASVRSFHAISNRADPRPSSPQVSASLRIDILCLATICSIAIFRSNVLVESKFIAPSTKIGERCRR